MSQTPTSLQDEFASLLEQSFAESNQEGSVVTGYVTRIEGDNVIVDVGLKAEGIVSFKEFERSGLHLAIGDTVSVYLERMENRQGNAVLSYEKALRERSWDELEKVLEKGETVDGVISGKVKGGFTVDIKGVLAFLPGSQVDIRPIRDIGPLMNIVQPFQILKMDRRQGNIVVSRRAIMEESREEARNELLSHISEGQVLEGTVKNITDYGAFIDLGSIDGLLHVTDISWSRINHPSEVLTIGQKINVQVIKYNRDTRRVSLGMKQLEGNPWKDIETRYPKNAKMKGAVTNITDYGAFIELEPGIEGLVHISEISWSKTNQNPRKLLNVGDEVEFVILDIDPAKHRISLGMKQCTSNPWEQFAQRHPQGSTAKGFVKNVVEFGLFVGFEDDVDGLVHVSDLSWDEAPESQLANYKKDQEIDVMILSIDPDKERISLGIKQLHGDPFSAAMADMKKGQTVTVTVANVQDDGIEVTLVPGVTSFIKRNDLSLDKQEQRPERFAVGDRVDVKLVALDKATRKVGVSIRALEQEQHNKVIQEYGSADSGASLGDILSAAINKASEDK